MVEELFRYLCQRAQGLLSVRADGTVYRKTPSCADWTLYAKKKDDLSLEEWLERKVAQKLKLPAWQRDIKELPSEGSLASWMFDGVAESVTGDTVEPDGHGPDGAPSWLVALGLV